MDVTDFFIMVGVVLYLGWFFKRYPLRRRASDVPDERELEKRVTALEKEVFQKNK